MFRYKSLGNSSETSFEGLSNLNVLFSGIMSSQVCSGMWLETGTAVCNDIDRFGTTACDASCRGSLNLM